MKISYLLMLACWFFAGTSFATEEKYPFVNNQQRVLFSELTQELRCPKCQNQNLADSDAMIAADLKRKVHDLIQQGQTKQQIVDYMKQRYGDFVYYQPPLNPITIWLWVLPLLFIVAALTFVLIRRNRSLVTLNNQQRKQIDELLERDE